MDGASERDGLRAAAVSVSAADVARIGERFHQAFPHASAKRVLYWTQALTLIALAYGLYVAISSDADLVGRVALIGAYALFASMIALRLYAAASLGLVWSRLAEHENDDWPVYTILCPLYREANIAPDLITALSRLDYPRAALDIKILVEADDIDTIEAALAAADAAHIEVVIIAAAGPRTKPKALNVGLERARGQYLAVYDAEDRPHPLQLHAAVAAFENGGADLACVQAPLAVDNAPASWIARQFAAEYAIQFREILPLLAGMNLPLPLGGSSNHFRTDALRALGGWDPYNVTEDADLGYRLARYGWRAGAITPPTWEEAPITFKTWLSQRTRWIKGHLHTWLVLMRDPIRTAREMGLMPFLSMQALLAGGVIFKAWLSQRTRWIKGHLHTWLVLMRDPIRTAREMGLMPFLSMQVLLAGGVIAALAHGPLALIVLGALISPDNILGPAGFVLALCGYCVGVFAALTAAALSGDLSHIRAAPTMPLCWPLQTIAAVRAIFDLLVRPHHWAKTAHGVSGRAKVLSRVASVETEAQRPQNLASRQASA